MFKVTVLYGHPKDEAHFEKYYTETHTPIAQRIPGLHHMEVTKFVPFPDGSLPAHYRMTELYFETPETMALALNSEHGKLATDDLANFASGGATFIIGVGQNITAIQ